MKVNPEREPTFLRGVMICLALLGLGFAFGVIYDSAEPIAAWCGR